MTIIVYLNTILKTMSSNISIFYEHELQWIMALFLTNPQLYCEYTKHRYLQDYFFEQFHKFAADYHRFSGDECVYFGSTRKEVAGEANICGGIGKVSASTTRYFKNKYRRIEESHEKLIDKFAKKYSVSFEPGSDTRLFLGVTEIWNRLDTASEIVAMSKYADVRERSYDDASLETAFPPKLEKTLVPLEIRNRVMQKSSAKYVRSTPSRIIDVDMEEREYIASKTKMAEDVSYEQKPVSGVVFVPPEQNDEDEW